MKARAFGNVMGNLSLTTSQCWLPVLANVHTMFTDMLRLYSFPGVECPKFYINFNRLVAISVFINFMRQQLFV